MNVDGDTTRPIIICADCLSANCRCSKDQENIETIPENITSSDFLYEDKHLNIYNKVLEKYIQRWKSISFEELSTLMDLKTLTTAKIEEIDSNATKFNVCKLCLEDSTDSRMGHYLLIFYSLSLPLTNQTLIDLFVIWALSRNQPHKLLHWINTITPIDVALHFFLNGCCAYFKPDEKDGCQVRPIQSDRISLLKYIFKCKLTDTIHNTDEMNYIRDLVTTSNIFINPVANGLCTCNEIKPNLGEELANGRNYKAQMHIFSENKDAVSAKESKEAQAIRFKASSILKTRTKLNELSVCCIGSNGVIYNNKDRNAKIKNSDSKRFEMLNHFIEIAENENVQVDAAAAAAAAADDGEMSTTSDTHKNPRIEEVDVTDDEDVDEDDEIEDNYEDDKIEHIDDDDDVEQPLNKTLSTINMFNLFKTNCQICNLLPLKKFYTKFNNISEAISNQIKENMCQTNETIIWKLDNEICEPFDKDDLCHHNKNSFCQLNTLRHWQFYNIAIVYDEDRIKHDLCYNVSSRSCTICIDLYVAVILDQIATIKNTKMLQLRRWVQEVKKNHLIG